MFQILFLFVKEITIKMIGESIFIQVLGSCMDYVLLVSLLRVFFIFPTHFC